nr:unnamed protein product [Callosobruchus analis]
MPRKQLVYLNLNKDWKEFLGSSPTDQCFFGLDLEWRLKMTKSLQGAAHQLKVTNIVNKRMSPCKEQHISTIPMVPKSGELAALILNFFCENILLQTRGSYHSKYCRESQINILETGSILDCLGFINIYDKSTLVPKNECRF